MKQVVMSKIRASIHVCAVVISVLTKFGPTWFINPNWKCRFIQYLMHVGYNLHSPLDQIGNVRVSLCHFFKLVHRAKLEKASKLYRTSRMQYNGVYEAYFRCIGQQLEEVWTTWFSTQFGNVNFFILYAFKTRFTPYVGLNRQRTSRFCYFFNSVY